MNLRDAGNRNKLFLTSLILLFTTFSYGTEFNSTLIITGITDEAPFEYTNTKSGYDGIYPELWNIWSGRTGIPVKYIVMKKDEALKALAAGTVDAIMGYESASGDTELILSNTLYTAKIHIFSKNNISSVESVADLEPFIVGIRQRDEHKLKKAKPDITYHTKRTVNELIECCEKGHINVFISDADAAGFMMKMTGLWRKYTQSDKPVMLREIKAAVLPGNVILLEKINKGFTMINEIEKYIISGTFSGGNIRYRISRVYVLTVILIILLIGGVAGFWIWNIQLQKKVEAATFEIKIMKDRAEAANITRNRFLDNISHELRTPLTLILAPVEEAITSGTIEKDMLGIIRRNGRILLTLINNLLDLSKMTADRMKLNVSETDMAAEIKLYCDEMESTAARKSIEIKCTVPEGPVTAFIDRGKFSHVLSNFFSNSLRFAEKGRITVEINRGIKNVILTFSDTGTGIPASMTDTIFDRFTQADSVNEKNYDGTGIGLAIVKGIIKMHSGTVTVTSRYIDDYPDNHGTAFTVTIPSGKEHLIDRKDVVFIDNAEIGISSFINDNDVEYPAGNPSKGTVTVDDEKPAILVVEDNRDMQKCLREILSDRYNIFTAYNGVEALQVLDRNDSIDLILSDVLMPGMNGQKLMERIHADERFAGLPVLFLTAVADISMKNKNLELGAVDYLIKPFDPDELRLRVKNQIQLRVMRNYLLKRNYELSAKLKSFIETRKPSLTKDTKKKMETICSFINEHYTEDLTRELLASSIEMNPDIFSRMFNLYTGRTLPDFINSLRIEQAKKYLLETDITVSRISINTGYENLRTFNRVFKKITGMSPVEYRGRG